MKKLIERKGVDLVCDNPECNFSIKLKPSVVPYLHVYIGARCPECDQVLLTEKDYDRFMSVDRAVKFINRWFSWIAIFISSKNHSTASIETHNSIKINSNERRNP